MVVSLHPGEGCLAKALGVYPSVGIEHSVHSLDFVDLEVVLRTLGEGKVG